MNLPEFKKLFSRRRLCLFGDSPGIDWIAHTLEDIGFNSQSTDDQHWRQGIQFQGEIWATASGKNWTFRRPYDFDSRPVIYMPIHEFQDLLNGVQTSEEEITCSTLEDIL